MKRKNSHNLRDEVLAIVSREGELALDNHITRVKAGDMIHITARKKHGIKALSNLDFMRFKLEWEYVMRTLLGYIFNGKMSFSISI
jgi:quercetin dioxygenase-like cupin family protein